MIVQNPCVTWELNNLHLFIESKFLRDTEWLMKSMEEGFRLQSVLITAPDVLQPHVMKKVTFNTNPYLRWEVNIKMHFFLSVAVANK